MNWQMKQQKKKLNSKSDINRENLMKVVIVESGCEDDLLGLGSSDEEEFVI